MVVRKESFRIEIPNKSKLTKILLSSNYFMDIVITINDRYLWINDIIKRVVTIWELFRRTNSDILIPSFPALKKRAALFWALYLKRRRFTLQKRWTHSSLRLDWQRVNEKRLKVRILIQSRGWATFLPKNSFLRSVKCLLPSFSAIVRCMQLVGSVVIA